MTIKQLLTENTYSPGFSRDRFSEKKNRNSNFELRIFQLYLLCVLCVFCENTSPTFAQDQTPAPAPQSQDWPTFRGDPQLTGSSSAKLPTPLKQLWKVNLKGSIESTAAIADGRVFVGTQKDRLVALNLNDGNQLWEFKTNDSVSASPCVANGRVFVGDESGTFYAIDAEKGAELWRFQAKDKIRSSATAVDNQILVGSYDNALRSFDAATGKLNWEFFADAQVHCSPAILPDDNGEKRGGAAVIAGCDRTIRAIDLKTGQERSHASADDACAASAAIKDSNAYVGNLKGDFLSVNLKTGNPNWKISGDDPTQPMSAISASAAVTQDAVFIGTQDGKLIRFARQTGKIDWTFTARGSIESSPIIVDNRVYFGSSDGTLYALDANTGNPTWKFTAGGQIKASPSIVQNRLLIGTSQGILYCFGK
ncbi:MAG: PQQ-binding-like beta-propeller repeat protein [Phycisphaerales bacterium]|nr:PQQ-binding-like beta-propeller repeat protein [Phycisphaerales bacterium]